MGKYLRVTMPDDSQWDVPALLIAESRARYYAELDVKRGDATDFDQAFADEVEYALGDSYEIEDWAANNMNWSDVASAAVQVVAPPSTVDYQKGWVNGEKDVIEK